MKMRDTIEQETIERGELKKLFSMRTDRTIDSYIKKGVFKEVGHHPRFDPFDQSLFDYGHICKILGIKKLPNEPFLTTEETITVLGLPKGYNKGLIRPYCQRHKIPYYTLSNAKGTKTYFLRSEIEKSAEYKIKWGTEFPDYVAKNYFLRNIFKRIMNPVFIKSLNDTQTNVVTEIILNGRNFQQASENLNIPYHICNVAFSKACKKILYQMQILDFNFSQLPELAKEVIKLKLENKVLIGTLKTFTKGETPIQKQNIEFLSKSFDQSNLSARVNHLLTRLETNNLYDLTQFTRSQVEKYQDAGKKTVDAIEELLHQNGLDWKKEPEVIKIDLLSKLKEKKPYEKTQLQDVKSRLEEIEKKLKIKQ